MLVHRAMEGGFRATDGRVFLCRVHPAKAVDGLRLTVTSEEGNNACKVPRSNEA